MSPQATIFLKKLKLFLVCLTLIQQTIGFAAPSKLTGSTPPAESCKSALSSENSILTLARPLLLSFDQLTDAYPGLTIMELVIHVIQERERFINNLTNLRPSLNPVVQDMIDRNLHKFRLPVPILTKLEEVIALYGNQQIPTAPMSDNTYATWKDRFKEIRHISISIDQFGLLGELIVASKLPGLVAVNVRFDEVFSPAEQRLFKQTATTEEKAWLNTLKQGNMEIDVLFNDGQSIGETKIYKRPLHENTRSFQRIKKQADTIARLIQAYSSIGVHKTGYFIFFGATPSPTIIDHIQSKGLNVILLPYDFENSL